MVLSGGGPGGYPFGPHGVLGGAGVDVHLGTWAAAGRLTIPLGLWVDGLSAVFVLVITGVGLLIHVYSLAYMAGENDVDYARYFAGMNLFVAAMLLLVVFALATLAFVRPPTSEQALALSLERSAQELAAQATTPTDRALAEQALKTAEALRKTSTPPREKLQQVTSLLHELKQRSQAAAQAGAGQGASKNAAGTGAGTGTGTGKGSSPTAAGAGSAKGNQKPGEATIIKLETDLKKAQAQLESSSGPKTGPKPEPSAGPNQNQTLTRGKSPQQKGPEPQPQPNGATQKTPSQAANNQKQQAGQKPSPKKGGSAGDTRLGEFPKPERFVRFYRPGEKGAPLEIRNARYMVFRIPPAPAAAGGGKTVLDSGRPKASVPYTNVPLRVGTLPAAPEERQMVPYRYRDLIY
jgi:hypothetical protein